MDRFTACCERGRSAAAAADWPGVASWFGMALALWQGDPLADVPSPVLQRDEVPALAELRLQALESAPAADLLSAGAKSVPASPVPASPVVPKPAQLPADTTDFTGRDAEVELLCGLLASPPTAGRAGAVVISAVAGMGGIGKTALAVHVAHRLRDRFPDGQLFVSLQGATSPLRPCEVLAGFLRDLGVPDAGIPAREAERAARYRTLLADRRILIVLDDARDAAQVRPLLPGTAGCGVIVTSRNSLPGLPGAALLGLDVLSSSEAQALFSAIAGPGRVMAEPTATDSVLDSCAGLPLAIRIAASRLALRPGWSITHLSGKLADERGRLAELTAGDLAVHASFAVSYNALPAGPPDPAQVFRLLGLTSAAHLLESPAPDRFRLHDLLRSYAAELAGHTDSAHDTDAAVGRMLRWYGEQAVIASRALSPGRRFPASVLFRPAAAAEAMAEPAQALDWYETELAGLLAAARLGAGLGRQDVVVQIAVGMADFFQRTPHAEDWLAIIEIGVRSARHLGDEAILSSLLNCHGQACSRMGRLADSHRCLSEALAIRQRTGDRSGEAGVLNSLAVNLHRQQRFDDALEYLRRRPATGTGRA